MLNLKNRKTKKSPIKLVNQEQAPFAYVEAYKSLRTNLDFLAAKNGYHSILVTSGSPNEGKTTLCLNLVCSLAESGKKVLLMDCDLRKSSVAAYLKKNRRNFGVTDVLAGKCTLDDAIFFSDVIRSDVLLCGTIPDNPAELMGSAEMVQLLQNVSVSYDYVIIDTPPVCVVTDAAILSRYVDGCVLVARSNVSTKQNFVRARQALEDVQANLVGAVLNDYDSQKSAYGRAYFAYQEYGYGKEKSKDGMVE